MAITDTPCALPSPIPMQGTAQHNEILGAHPFISRGRWDRDTPKSIPRASCLSTKLEVVQKWFGGDIFSSCITSLEIGFPAAWGRHKGHEEQWELCYRAGVLR